MNVRGISDVTKRRAIFNYYRKTADILCLSETHSTKQSEIIWTKEWGGCGIFSHGETNARGVCLLAKKQLCISFNNIRSDPNGRFLMCDVKTINDFEFTLCVLYAPNKDSPVFFDAIRQNLMEYSHHKLIVGDFNLVMDPVKDRWNSQSNNDKSREVIRLMQTEMMLSEIWRTRNPDKQQFSWRRNVGSHKNQQASRIDFALVGKPIEDLCEHITYLQGIKTDHSALFLSMKDFVLEKGNGYWKFNSSHLKSTSFVQKIKTEMKKDIEATKFLSPLKRWESVKRRLQKVLKSASAARTSTKNLIIAQLSEIVGNYEEHFPLTESEMKLYINTKADLEERLMEKARSLIFRSKVKWFNEGEKNTKYFFALERARSAAKLCSVIIRDDGTEALNNDDILQEQVNFYRQLYHADESVKFDLKNETGSGITLEQEQTFNMPFTYEEITMAVSMLRNGKAPGKDGLTAEVYKCFWSEIGPILYDAYADTYDQKLLHDSAREGILNLLPKANRDPRFLKNLRPITLLNVDYKIIEKAVAYRLCEGMKNFIHSDQTGFMPSRRMAVNIRKTLDLMNFCTLENIPALLINLDYLMAFDRVEVPSVIKSLVYFRFPPYVINWIRILYTDFTCRIQNNGFISLQKVDVERSVHQGVCASAYLYNT